MMYHKVSLHLVSHHRIHLRICLRRYLHWKRNCVSLQVWIVRLGCLEGRDTQYITPVFQFQRSCCFLL